MQPKLNQHGEIENFTVRITGEKLFRCRCGCNVFHKPDNTRPEYYQCNGCKSTYDTVPADMSGAPDKTEN